MTHIASAGRPDAITLVEKLKNQLPAGSTQAYAAMLVLNYIDSYSENDGLRMETQDRLAITALSLEFLYMAWYNDVGIELSERQLENWPSHVWKNSANWGIDLRSLVKQPNLRSMHDRLRDVRTLLSFGAVVNRYYELIQFQTGGLKAFIRTYQPTESVELKPPSLLPLLPPPPLPKAYSIESNNKTKRPGWNWLPWGIMEKTSINQSTTPLKPPKIPGPMPRPSVEVLPLYVTDSTAHLHLVSCETASNNSLSSSLIPSCDSGMISGTSDRVATTQISALERLEAYLSVLGTPQCEPVKLLSSRKLRLVSLVEAEKAAKASRLQEPVREPIRLPLASLTASVQRELLRSRSNTATTLRWMTGQELKSREVVWKPVDHRLEVLKGNKRVPKLTLEPVKDMMPRDAKSDIIVVDEAHPGSKIPNTPPLKIVKKGSKVGSD
ncbi:hypothetical protein B0J17DRAFT_770071 [Rhizoctonia solani]|nr:hypothetical protein B0J17DRAFT_770071 [Rhizoctonia solani]